MACARRRCFDGGANHLESSDRSLEECANLESRAQLSSSVDACVAHAQPRIKCGRDWPDGLSPDSTGGRTIHCASNIWTSELEVRWEEKSGDGGKTPYRYTAASVFHQDTLKALGGQQETELHVSATIKHHTDDESKPDRNRGTVRVC